MCELAQAGECEPRGGQRGSRQHQHQDQLQHPANGIGEPGEAVRGSEHQEVNVSDGVEIIKGKAKIHPRRRNKKKKHPPDEEQTCLPTCAKTAASHTRGETSTQASEQLSNLNADIAASRETRVAVYYWRRMSPPSVPGSFPSSALFLGLFSLCTHTYFYASRRYFPRLDSV